MNRPKPTEPAAEPSAADLAALFDLYLAQGCPCRFPRFRATVSRDMSEVGAREWDISDIRRLLELFDQRVPLTLSKRDAYSTHGQCARCGAEVHRYGMPIFRDSFIERARITPGTLPDVGAPVDGPVPICGIVFQAAPGNATRTEAERIEAALPRLSPRLWLDYMSALPS